MNIFWKIIYYSCICFVMLIALVAGSVCAIIRYNYIDFSILEVYEATKPSILLDDAGEEWGSFSLEKHADIAFSHMPVHLINAFVAAEDHAFFYHSGISWTGIVRSFLINCYHGKIVQGASTITQQLVKLLFTDSQRTFKRKIKEQFLALIVERQITKEQIFQTYLNHVYFGAGLYGVEAASKRFWGKAACELSLSEAATLAAIVKNPGHYCPLWYPLSAQKRRAVVLHSMKQLSFINQEEYDAAIQEPMVLVTATNTHKIPYIKEAIRLWLEPLVGKEMLYGGGLRIATTINQKLQEVAETSFSAAVKKLRAGTMPLVDGGLISMDVSTGHIKALIGGFNFNQSQFNRALQARRQLGSLFKPLLYAAAVQSGISLLTTADDEPLEIILPSGVWRPRNANRQFQGQVTLARALATSNNIVSVKTFLNIPEDQLRVLMKKCHLPVIEPLYPSLGLGCIDCTVQEVAGMFNIFANNGYYCKPYLVRWVADQSGKKIIKNKPTQEYVLSPLVVGQVASVLQVGITRACQRAHLYWMQGNAIGKTGTTNESRTVWFGGSTPSLTTIVYLGNDDNSSLGKNVFPNRTAFPIWFGIHNNYHDARSFTYDPRLVLCTIDDKTGKRCTPLDANALPILLPLHGHDVGHLTIDSAKYSLVSSS